MNILFNVAMKNLGAYDELVIQIGITDTWLSSTRRKLSWTMRTTGLQCVCERKSIARPLWGTLVVVISKPNASVEVTQIWRVWIWSRHLWLLTQRYQELINQNDSFAFLILVSTETVWSHTSKKYIEYYGRRTCIVSRLDIDIGFVIRLPENDTKS